MYLCICVFVFLCICVFVFLCICVFVYLYSCAVGAISLSAIPLHLERCAVVAAVVVIVHFHFSANCFQMQLDCNASLAMQCVVQNFHNGAFEITTLHAQ